MSTFDLNEKVDRRHSDCAKWNVEENELPMWIADMDFKAAPAIQKALAARLAHGVFGYSEIPDAWANAYISWWRDRHGFTMQGEWLMFVTGVVPAISSVVRKLTTPGERVLIQTPVYNIFFNSIVNNGRFISESPLSYKNGVYEIDFDDLEEKLSDKQTSLMILCNPHNPVGKLWDKATLARIGALCKKHHVTVLSDEIHCDITAPNTEYVPFASVDDTCREISVTCIAPTKAFNLAGLQTACISVPDPVLRHKVWRGINTDEVAEPNAFAVDATVAAFTEGGAWLDAMRAHVFENRHIVEQYIAENIPEIHVVKGDATYLVWLDCSALGEDATPFAEFLRKETGLFVSSGGHYGESGKAFLRMNVATTRTNVQDGLTRLKRGIELYLKK